jgi:hypothetical protein
VLRLDLGSDDNERTEARVIQVVSQGLVENSKQRSYLSVLCYADGQQSENNNTKPNNTSTHQKQSCDLCVNTTPQNTKQEVNQHILEDIGRTPATENAKPTKQEEEPQLLSKAHRHIHRNSPWNQSPKQHRIVYTGTQRTDGHCEHAYRLQVCVAK